MPNYKRYYLDNHYVFITMVTYQRIPHLIKNINLLKLSFQKSKEKYQYEIFAISILQEHIHMIIKPQNSSDFSKIIGNIKRYYTYNLDGASKDRTLPLSESRLNRKEAGIWQRRFYDHIIRDEEDLYKHLDYIHYNPVKHNLVKNVKDWEYSSFHKFVEKKFYDINWGSLEDIRSFSNLDFD